MDSLSFSFRGGAARPRKRMTEVWSFRILVTTKVISSDAETLESFHVI